MVTPAAYREAAGHLQAAYEMSERRAAVFWALIGRACAIRRRDRTTAPCAIG